MSLHDDDTRTSFKPSPMLEEADLPRKDIIVAERWLGKTVDGHVITLDEAAVCKNLWGLLY